MKENTDKNIHQIIDRNIEISEGRKHDQKRIERVAQFVEKVASDEEFVKKMIKASLHNANPENHGMKRTYLSLGIQRDVVEKVKSYGDSFALEEFSEGQISELISLVREKVVAGFNKEDEVEKILERWDEEFKKNYRED